MGDQAAPETCANTEEETKMNSVDPRLLAGAKPEDKTKGKEPEDGLGGLDGPDIPDMIKLKSGDGKHTVEMKRKFAEMSCLVSHIREGDKTAREIEIPNVTGDILEHVGKYLLHHQGKTPAPIAKPIKSADISKIVQDPWDAEFINGLKKTTEKWGVKRGHLQDHLGCQLHGHQESHTLGYRENRDHRQADVSRQDQEDPCRGSEQRKRQRPDEAR